MASIEKLYSKALNLWQSNDLNAAKDNFKKVIEKKPKNAEALSFIGIINLQQGFFEDGISYLNRAQLLDPNNENIKLNLSNGYVNLALSLIEKFEEHKALENLLNATQVNPMNAVAWLNLLRICSKLKQYQLAQDSFNKIKIKNHEILFQYGNIKFDQKEYLEAIDLFLGAMKQKEEFPECLFHIALSYQCLGKYNESLNFFDKTLNLKPDYHLALFNKAQLYLRMNNFEEGWKIYKARWKTKNFLNLGLESKIPYFNKEIEANKKVLVWAEQGIGDQVLYSSMLEDFSKLKKHKVTVSIDERLISLYQRSFKDIDFISQKRIISDKDFDYQLPMGDLGLFVRNKIDQFKNQKTFLIADQKKIKFLGNNLKKVNKKNIGLSWTSNNNDFLDKSVNLSDFKNVFYEFDYQYINLEYVDNSNDIIEAQKKYQISFNDTKNIDKFNDLDSLAALISACDIIITISNVTAHFAGALGIKTILLAPYGLGQIWYWSDDSYSKWYPNLKILKQKVPYDWSNVMEDLITELRKIN